MNRRRRPSVVHTQVVRWPSRAAETGMPGTDRRPWKAIVRCLGAAVYKQQPGARAYARSEVAFALLYHKTLVFACSGFAVIRLPGFSSPSSDSSNNTPRSG